MQKIKKHVEELEKQEYWRGYIEKQNEAVEICKICKYRKRYKELEQKESILDKVTDKLKERIKELDKLKENYIKLKEYDQVDFTLCKKREVQKILNIIEGEKK